MADTNLGASRARIAVAVALSVIVHGVFGAVTDRGDPRPLQVGRRGVQVAASANAAGARRGAADAMRRAWYARAMADAGAGRLSLGSTLLHANAIDAYAEGTPFDLEAARRAYDARRARFREARQENDARRSAFATFDDLSYAGTPGGRMGDLLLQARGACEPLSHLVVAVLFDEGVHGVSFRYYGGSVGGITHLAPILRQDQDEVDLMSGDLALPGGATFAPREIIEVYARAHGIVEAPPRRAREEDGGVFGSVAATRTLDRGYPPDDTRFEGAFPLFAEQAMRAPRPLSSRRADANGQRYHDNASLNDDFPHCTSLLRFASLDDVAIPLATPSGTASISFEIAPRPEALERIAGFAHALEVYRDDEDRIVRIAALACLAGVYQRAARDFGLAGKDEIAARAAREARRAQEEGSASLTASTSVPGGRAALLARFDDEAPGESWSLLFLPGGAGVFEDGLPKRPDAIPVPYEASSSRILLGAALIVAPDTRAATIRSMRTLSADDQVEVMHEIFGAHDARRPWSSSYEVTAPEGLEDDPFVRANAIFHRLAWALWDAERPPLETLAALKRDLDATPQAAPLGTALFSYLIKNALTYAVIKRRDRAVVGDILRWIRENRIQGIERSVAVLEAMAAAPRFDLASLADAQRDESRARARSVGPPPPRR